MVPVLILLFVRLSWMMRCVTFWDDAENVGPGALVWVCVQRGGFEPC